MSLQTHDVAVEVSDWTGSIGFAEHSEATREVPISRGVSRARYGLRACEWMWLVTQAHQNLSLAEPAHPLPTWTVEELEWRAPRWIVALQPTVRSPVNHSTQHITGLNLQDSRIDRPRVYLSLFVDEDTGIRTL